MSMIIQQRIEQTASQENMRSETVMMVQCLSLMAKYVGNRMAPFLQPIITLLSQIMKKLNENMSNDVDNELSEACLNTI